MVVTFFIAVSTVVVRWRATKACCPPNEPPIEIPAASRPNESLVVETGRQECVQSIVDTRKIATHVWPAIHAAGLKAIAKFQARRRDVGFVFGSSELHNRIGLIDAGREDAAGSVIFEASTDQVHAVS